MLRFLEIERVSEADKAYMRRLGEYERQARQDELDYLWSLSLDERVRRSIAMARPANSYARKEPKDLGALYRRRQLGLYLD